MSRKSLIISLVILTLMILGVGIAVFSLYSGGEDDVRSGNVVPDEERYLLLPAVPADAVLVACISNAGLIDNLTPFGGLQSSPMLVSLHYNGNLQALYVFDAGMASSVPSDDASALMKQVKSKGMYAEFVDCSASADSGRLISGHSVILVSKTESLVQSSKRHLEQGLSVVSASGFTQASAAPFKDDVVFLSNVHSKLIAPGIFSRQYSRQHPFIASLTQWTVMDISKADTTGVGMNVYPVFGDDPSKFMNAVAASAPGYSSVAHMLPSFTISAFSLPMEQSEPYLAAYQEYLESNQALRSRESKRAGLKSRRGISPEDFVRRLDVREVAKASFMLGGKVEDVNLMRIAREDTLLFIGMDNKSFRDYRPGIHSWPYKSYIASMFGSHFELENEDCFTYMNGWVISGSMEAVREYTEGRALSYTLLQYMADAGRKNLFPSVKVPMVIYYSMTEHPEGRDAMFSKSFGKLIETYHTGCDYCPVVIAAQSGKNGMYLDLRMPKLNMLRTKAPEFVRDTTVVIPQGPFRVKNSATGRTNLFLQNSHGAICLQEEDGKGIWGVPFKGKLCGTAHNLDYYGNGKLQIIFGAGSRIYVIDRKGHYVNGFPLDLGSEIVLGPDIYDFNGTNAYNIMVLHKDNVIEMYNLKGRKPSSWTTIKAPETVKSLPERITVGGKTFWVVRTAIRTLIYPFGGGEPLTTFKGDEMIRPDSPVEVFDATSVNVRCYDGKTRTVKVK